MQRLPKRFHFVQVDLAVFVGAGEGIQSFCERIKTPDEFAFFKAVIRW